LKYAATAAPASSRTTAAMIGQCLRRRLPGWSIDGLKVRRP